MNLAAKREQYVKLLDTSLHEAVARLSRLGNVRRVSLFGSYGRGRADLFTDLDILVIMETSKPFLQRIAELYSLLALPVDADILCYTPEEFDRMKNRPFMRRILAEEVVLLSEAALLRKARGGWSTPGEDLKWAKDLAERGGYHIACFLSQQVGEKALKAFLYGLRGRRWSSGIP